MNIIKYIIILSAFLFFACEKENNNYYSNCKKMWFNVYGTPEQELASSVCITQDNGYIVCGSSDNSNSGSDILYIIKTDCNGNMVWEHTYYNYSEGDCIRALKNGGFIIYGFTNNYDLFLIEINDNGDLIWSKSYSENDLEFSMENCLEISADGGFIFAGRTIVGNNDEILIIKTNNIGEEQWRQIINGDYDYRASGIVQLKEGYLIAGQKRERPWTLFKSNIFLAKLTKEGSIEWMKDYESIETQYAEDILLTSYNEIYILGTEGVGGNVSHPLLLLKKVDINGEEIWSKTFDSNILPTHNGIIGVSIAQGISHQLLLLGNTNEEQDILIIKTDREGNEILKKSFGVTNYFIDDFSITYSGNDYGTEIIPTNDFGYIIAGFTTAFGSGGADMFLLKLNSMLEGKYELDSIPEY